MNSLFATFIVVLCFWTVQGKTPAFVGSSLTNVVAWDIVDLAESYNIPRRAILTIDQNRIASEVAGDLFRPDDEYLTTVPLEHLGMLIVEFSTNLTFTNIGEILDHVIASDGVTAIENESIVSIPSSASPSEPSTSSPQLLDASELCPTASKAYLQGDDIFLEDTASSQTTETSLELLPNDPLYPLLWGLPALRTSEAWRIAGAGQRGAYRPTVMVIDSGVDYLHSDLAENVWTNEAEANGIDGVDDDGNGYIDDIHGWNAINRSGDPMDDHWHGTHCAGIVGGRGNNGIGVVGVSWSPLIQACKFIRSNGQGSISDALTCLDYALATRAEISNNSWGSRQYSPALRTALSRMASRGHIFVAAAGNAGLNVDSYPFYPAGLGLPNIVSVAAMSENGRLASFSNYGRLTVHVVAPGAEIASTYPNDRYAYSSGTSMASPYVAGLLALAKSVRPNMGYTTLLRLLRTTSVEFERSSKVAWGKPDAFDLISAMKQDENPSPLPHKMHPPVKTEIDESKTVMMVIGASTSNCVETCGMSSLACEESVMEQINNDADSCFDWIVASEINGNWVKGSSDDELSYHPGGCYATFQWTTHVVNVNTAAGDKGCLAATAEISRSFKVCACVAHGD